VKRTPRPKPIAPNDPYSPCGNCVGGWVTVYVKWGSMEVPSEKRCPCFVAHQAKIRREQPRGV